MNRWIFRALVVVIFVGVPAWFFAAVWSTFSLHDDTSDQGAIPAWAKVAPEQIAEAKKHGVPVAFENDLGMRFVLIPAGTFVMGSPEEEEGREDDESQHEVTLTQPFYTQVTEVTRRQWLTMMEAQGVHTQPSLADLTPERAARPQRGLYPDAVGFTAWLSQYDTARDYRLPTEAEWERACRAGTTSAYWTGGTLSETQANFRMGGRPFADCSPRRVGSYAPSPWGLHDMHGNVREWCRDCFAPHGSASVVDPLVSECSETPVRRVVRGGSATNSVAECRSASRASEWAIHFSKGPSHGTGFRLVSPLPER